MADKKKRPSRLGRGLSSLMAQPVAATPPGEGREVGPTERAAGPSVAQTPEASRGGRSDAQPSEASAAPGGGGGGGGGGGEAGESAGDAGLTYLPLDAIVPNRHQPRQQFDDATLRALAESIGREGVMQPVVVRPGDQVGRYELVAGERRWRAAGLAGLDRIPALLRHLDDQQTAEWALIENLQREDLNPMERAEAFARLGEQFAMSHEQIASRVGLERSTVSNLLRLLSLAPPVQQLMRDELLSMGQARAIAAVPDASQQEALARRAVREGLSVRMVEQLARRSAGPGPAPGDDVNTPGRPSPAGRPSHFADLEQQIGQQLGTRVAIHAGRRKGAGKLTIEFYSLDQFDTLLARLGVVTD